MERALVAGGAMVVLGGLIALQPPVNAALGRAIGSTQAVWLSFLIAWSR